MNIDISKIIQEKIAAMETDGSVKRLIEDDHYYETTEDC